VHSPPRHATHAQCTAEGVRGKKDFWNGVLGGAAAGSVIGVRGACAASRVRVCFRRMRAPPAERLAACLPPPACSGVAGRGRGRRRGAGSHVSGGGQHGAKSAGCAHAPRTKKRAARPTAHARPTERCSAAAPPRRLGAPRRRTHRACAVLRQPEADAKHRNHFLPCLRFVLLCVLKQAAAALTTARRRRGNTSPTTLCPSASEHRARARAVLRRSRLAVPHLVQRCPLPLDSVSCAPVPQRACRP
jgi:hypothetical protein